MANLTISVDGELLKQARLRALKEGTSVNRLLRERLESYVEDERRRGARSLGGDGQLVALLGEAGIGKSRLAAEIATIAASRRPASALPTSFSFV